MLWISISSHSTAVIIHRGRWETAFFSLYSAFAYFNPSRHSYHFSNCKSTLEHHSFTPNICQCLNQKSLPPMAVYILLYHSYWKLWINIAMCGELGIHLVQINMACLSVLSQLSLRICCCKLFIGVRWK